MTATMTMTTKQRQIMNTVVRLNEDGSFLDLDQILDRLTYRTSKQSLQFSIRFLIKKGFLIKQGRERRRGRSRVILSPTKFGYMLMSV